MKLEVKANLKPVYIEASTLDDAWHQAVFELFKHGYKYKIDHGSYEGSYRLEFDWATIRIKFPGVEPTIPVFQEGSTLPPPTTMEYVRDYFERYIMSARKEIGEQYTYGERLVAAPIDGLESPIDQINTAIKRYKEFGFNSNQVILQVAQPKDITLEDPSCLRHIDTRVRYGALHLFPYFRSWDLWGGFPANLGAIQLLKSYMAAELDVEDGEIIASSKGLHLYKHVEEIAKMRFNIQ